MSLLGLAGSPPADLFISIPIFERGVAFDEWDMETFEAFPRIEGSEWEEYEGWQDSVEFSKRRTIRSQHCNKA